MDKLGRLIIILLLIAVLILGGFTCWKMTENQKRVNEKIEKIEKILVQEENMETNEI